MRILRISQNLYPEQSGGASYHVHAMSRDQAEMGHEVTVLTTRDDDELPRNETRDGYEIRRFDTLVSPLGNDISVGLARHLRQVTDFDVIHAHSHLYFSTNLAALKRRLGDIPLAITNHGLYSQSAPERLFRWYLKTLGRWTFDQADVTFCYTETDRERVQAFGVTSDISVISNGIDTTRFTPAGPETELIDSDGPIILFVGRLVDGKRPELAIEVFNELRHSKPDASLVICGDGPKRNEIRQLVTSYDVEDSVVFLGQVPFDEMPKVYRRGDMVLFPSRAEGISRTILESMATNIPVVMSDLDQFEDLYGDHVCPVNFESHSCVTDTIMSVLADTTCSTREQIRRDYQWEGTVQSTTSTLRKIAV